MIPSSTDTPPSPQIVRHLAGHIRDGCDVEGREAIRVLMVAEAANPEWVSVPLEGWSHSRAIAELCDAHLVTQIRNREAICRTGLQADAFTAIDSEFIARPVWRLGSVLRGGTGKGWTTITALNALTYYYFERLVWKRFKKQLRKGQFDVVHRITPLSPTIPSLLAGKCAEIGIPFVLGPLNGGLVWPRQFETARRKEREWLSYVRGSYKLLPGYGGTRRHASAIVVGSRATWEQVAPRYRDKRIYVPENGVDPDRFARPASGPVSAPLKIAFVGRLVPYKGVDMLLEAASPLIRRGRAVVDIIGDGPEMQRLGEIIARERIEGGVKLGGWIEHTHLNDRLVESDVFAFPSIREFGGGVVLEAMALGLLPVVIDYGGPGELVSNATGYAVPLGSRDEIVGRIRTILVRLADHPEVIRPMGQRARQRVLAHFTWETKARQLMEVYRWVRGKRADKPDFGMPLPD